MLDERTLSVTTYSTLGQAKGKADISNVFTFSQAHLLHLSSMQIAIRCFFIGTVGVCISLMLVLLIKAHKHTTDDKCEQNEVTEALYSEFTASQS